MITYELLRSYLPDRTIGKLSYKMYTLERPWLDNAPNVSCIPEGTYIVKRDKEGRFQFYSVENVPGRTFIEFHGGSTPKHSKGCILLGTGFDEKYNLTGSVDALKDLVSMVGDKGFTLTIRQYNPYTDKW